MSPEELAAYRKGADDMRREIERKFLNYGFANSLRLYVRHRMERPVREVSATIRQIELPKVAT